MKYEVIFEPDEGGGWHAHIPKVRGCRTWGRSLEAARRYIREALATCVDVFGEKADRVARDAKLLERVKLSGRAEKALAEYQRTRKRAEQLNELSLRLAGNAAVELTRREHLSLRDAGELLGLSHERVNQVIGSLRPKSGRRPLPGVRRSRVRRLKRRAA